ncbi:MAG: NADH-quinone oxidoreductase subunit A [Melioribacteraceae bacterium]|nr:NADH-quinone oxidoreductase subunit A [Melioribacteraceae bacterium]MCF8355325.1 NADH-quinone oxidoreductase subunit A [Melioribacteraceae bacterium]MCF8396334.1 NADH-quinone oxidoreductase subunit A [Melioribacteraceae bacterium]MCF8420403.1 NADH-quinone oxidoreductase subunit A [Melioribacteraceae bacterium]
MIEQYLPIFIVLFVAFVFGAAVIFSSKLFGPFRPSRVKVSPYESGKNPIGSTKERISIKYYMVAMLFIIFDIEVIFVYPWGVEFRRLFHEHGIFAFLPMLVFLVVLELGFLYIWKKGGLKWD